jgi:redox-sensitive bicupin YhaK (pirin superfamily)
LWIVPRTKGTPPRWAQRPYTREDRHNRLFPVVSPADAAVDGTLTIDQDATIYVSALDAGRAVVHESRPNRHAYLFVIKGGVEVNGRTLHDGDQARIADETRLEIAATGEAEIILLDLV